MAEPLHILIEFVRATDADDPFVEQHGRQEYLLRVDDGGYRPVKMSWDDKLKDLMEAVRRPGRDPAEVARLGNGLRRFLVPADWPESERAIAEATEAGRSVIVTIRSAAAEIYSLPFELLSVRATGQHLGEIPGVLVRYAWPETQTAPESPAPRLQTGRVLVAWSAAAGRVPAKEHIAAITRATERGHVPFVPERDVLAHADLERLSAALKDPEAPPVSVLHILAHGCEAGSVYGFALDHGDGGRAVIDPAQLRQVLAPHAGHLRLVVLAACDSANAGNQGNALGSVAQTLHRAGIDAVVASRFPFSVVGANKLTERLYGGLAVRPLSLEEALRDARTELLTIPEQLDWAGVQLYCRADRPDTRPIILRPYRGLLPFGSAHTRFFFGRDRERHDVALKLAELGEQGQPRFIVVAGASGTGKSSVVLSGVVPDLTGEGLDEDASPTDAHEDFERAVRRLEALLPKFDLPGVRQGMELLREAAGSVGGGARLIPHAILRPGRAPLAALDAALSGRPDDGRPFLLVVDQLEELFTHTADEGVRTRFCQRIWALSREETQVMVVCTIRVDFLGHCGHIVLDESGRRLDKVAYDDAHRVFVAQMERAQLRQAIEAPAHKVGLSLEAGLAERMLEDVGAEPGALPLLSYVLDLLWEQRSVDGVLTSAAYEALGGVGGALQKKADRLVDGMDEAQARQARRLLVRLVGTGETGARDTRRRALVDQIRPTDEAAVFDHVLGVLVDARLLVRGEEAGEATVEVAHEALIRKWERLRSWIDSDREMLAELDAIERWVGPYKEFGTLLDGDQLGFARQVAGRFPDDVSADARALVEASGHQRDRRRRIRVGVTVLVALCAIGIAVWQNELAGKATQAQLRAEEATEKAKLSAWLIAARGSDDPLVEAAILREGRLGTAIKGWEDAAKSVVATHGTEVSRFDVPDGEHLLGWTCDHNTPPGTPRHCAPERGVLVATQIDGGVRIRTAVESADIPVLETGEVDKVLFSPDGDHVATVAKDGSVVYWNARTKERISTVHGAGDPLSQVAFSTSGAFILGVGDSKRAWIWDSSTQQVQQLSGTPGIRYAAASPDEETVITANDDRTLRLWTVGSEAPPAVWRGHKMPAKNAEWSRDGSMVVSGSMDGTARIWSSTGESLGKPIRVAEAGPPVGAGWMPSGEEIVTFSQQGGTQWTLDGQKLGDIPAQDMGLNENSMAFSPDGKNGVLGIDAAGVMVVSTDDLMARPLSLSTPRAHATEPIAFTPSDTLVVVNTYMQTKPDKAAEATPPAGAPRPEGAHPAKPEEGPRTDGALRVYDIREPEDPPISGEAALREALWARTPYCLSPKQRTELLLEDAEEALQHAEQCRAEVDSRMQRGLYDHLEGFTFTPSLTDEPG